VQWVKGLKKAYYVAKKDIKIYYFTSPSLTWGVLLPLFLFLAFASGIRGSGDIKYMIPGLIGMAILFSTTSVEAVSIIFEKMEGTFERLLTAPLSFTAIIFGKTLAGVSFGLLTSTVVIILAVLFADITIHSPLLLIVGLILTALVFSALGLSISVLASKMWEAMSLSNFLRFPMVFLCGAFIPVSSLPKAVQWLAYFLPLTYSVDLIRYSMLENSLMPVYVNISALLLYFLVLWNVAIRALKGSLK